MLPLQKTTLDPNAKLDYTLDFTQWFNETATGDTILSVAWNVSPGLTRHFDLDSHTDMMATLWLSGGVLGKTYTSQCIMTTTLGRTAVCSLEHLGQAH